jgi:hypothetical protein
MIAATVGIGETDTIEHVLDFTSYAAPLSAATAKADLDEANATWFHGIGGVSKIVLWGHQWLWLLAKAGLVTSVAPLEDIKPRADVMQEYIIQRYGRVGKNTLWGVDVEIRS